MFYAFAHQYGRNVQDERGHLIGRVYRFRYAKHRQSFVDNGPDNFTAPDYIEALPSSHPAVRRAIYAGFWAPAALYGLCADVQD